MQAAQLLAFAGLLCGQASSANLDLRQGLAGWEGQGFRLTTADPTLHGAATVLSSADAGPNRKGMLRHVFAVPAGGGFIVFRAQALRRTLPADSRLDVLLLARGRQPVPRLMRTRVGWIAAPSLEPAVQGEAIEYGWDVSRLAGQTLQIVLLDDDERPGNHVASTGFRLVNAQDRSDEEFAAEMLVLQEKHQLALMSRYDSKRFTAFSNASEKFSVACLRNCELLYDLFYEHFRRKGFVLEHPPSRLMLAVFDSEQGFEAYLGKKMSSTITGIYHPKSNRLVVYDLLRNDALVEQRDKALERSSKIRSAIKRTTYVETVERQLRDRSFDASLGTIMHEAAHQLSFNCGMLNRQADLPIWLAEGLACYCESTDEGNWRGIGEPNTGRIGDLKSALKNDKELLPVEDLLRNDNWRNGRSIFIGYAQAWALFHMLMHEEPARLQQYLKLIYTRRTQDYRVLDFCQVFGSDLARFEQRHSAYVRRLAKSLP